MTRTLALAAALALLALPAHAEEKNEARAQRRSLAWAFVPFGVGQFANGDSVKGTLFFAGETLALGTAAASLGALEASKISGKTFESGVYRDPAAAETLQTLYLVGFWTGAVLAVGGVVEAVISHPSGEKAVAVYVTPLGLAARF